MFIKLFLNSKSWECLSYMPLFKWCQEMAEILKNFSKIVKFLLIINALLKLFVKNLNI